LVAALDCCNRPAASGKVSVDVDEPDEQPATSPAATATAARTVGMRNLRRRICMVVIVEE
jgi:hypothetical protein